MSAVSFTSLASCISFLAPRWLLFLARSWKRTVILDPVQKESEAKEKEAKRARRHADCSCAKGKSQRGRTNII